MELLKTDLEKTSSVLKKIKTSCYSECGLILSFIEVKVLFDYLCNCSTTINELDSAIDICKGIIKTYELTIDNQNLRINALLDKASNAQKGCD